MKAIGLEDLEGREQFFSKPNTFTPSLINASVFHRKLKIVEFIKRIDGLEVYQKLSESTPVLSRRPLTVSRRRLPCEQLQAVARRT